MIKRSGIYPGEFELYVGPMRSGKSLELLTRVEKLKYKDDCDYTFFKPIVDTRNNGIYSRWAKSEEDCIKVNDPREILDYALKNDQNHLIGIDEIMLFDGKSIVAVIEKLMKEKRNIVASGADLNFRGETFGPIGDLMAIATYVQKLTAVCTYKNCSNDATVTQRLLNGEPAPYEDPLISIEGNEERTYEPRCLNHYFIPGKPEL